MFFLPYAHTMSWPDVLSSMLITYSYVISGDLHTFDEGTTGFIDRNYAYNSVQAWAGFMPVPEPGVIPFCTACSILAACIRRRNQDQPQTRSCADFRPND